MAAHHQIPKVKKAKPSLKTEELQRHDLTRFLKRVSTPLGTKSYKIQSVMVPKDQNQIAKRKNSKPKNKLIKKSVPLIVSAKRPTTQPTSQQHLPKSQKAPIPKYGEI
jgi:hypothetical protein